jgi:hypothetical protein
MIQLLNTVTRDVSELRGLGDGQRLGLRIVTDHVMRLLVYEVQSTAVLCSCPAGGPPNGLPYGQHAVRSPGQDRGLGPADGLALSLV